MTAHPDQFFTKPEQAKACLAWLDGKLDLAATPFFIEPSTGGLGFFNPLPPGRRHGFEIDPLLAAKNSKIVCRDFLSINPLNFEDPSRGLPLVFVGNPPFGYRGKLAVAFINKAFELGAQYVAFILPPAFCPYADGAPPVIEKQVVGGHSIDHIVDLDPEYIQPGEDPKRIPNCCFVLFKKGARTEKIGSGLCSYASVHTCRTYSSKTCQPTGLQHIPDCDVFLPNALHEGQRKQLHAYDTFCMGAMFGVKIYKDKARVLKWIKGFDWPSVAKSSTNGNLSLGVRIINKALVEYGGFGAEGGPPPHTSNAYVSAYNIGTSQRSWGLKTWGQDKVELCHLFLPESIHYGSALKNGVQATEEMTQNRSIGLLIHKDTARVKKLIAGIDWLKHARKRTSTFGFTIRIVYAALAEVGLGERSPSHDSYASLYSIGEANKKTGRTEWGQDKIGVCDLFLPNSRRHGQAFAPSKTKEFQTVIGIQVHKNKAKLVKYLNDFDWASVARKSTNRNLSLNLDIVSRVLIDGGFIDA